MRWSFDITSCTVMLLVLQSGCVTWLPASLCDADDDCLAQEVCVPAGVCSPAPAILPSSDEVVPACELADVRILGATSIAVDVEIPGWVPNAADRTGACARRGDDALQTDQCASVESVSGSATIELGSLASGAQLEVFAFVTNTGGTSVSPSRTVQLPPGAVVNLTATDGESPEFVDLRWAPATGATNYVIWRDGIRIGSSSTAHFLDTDAAPGGLPLPIDDFVASAGEDEDAVHLRWQSGTSRPGAVHEYAVVATGPGGNAMASEVETGFRAGPPVTGYSLDVSDGRQLRLGTVMEFVDRLAPAGALELDNLVASDGTLRGEVEATFGTVNQADGAALTYTIRGLNAGGAGPEATTAGWRAAPAATVSWSWESDPYLGDEWTSPVIGGPTFVMSAPASNVVRVRAEWTAGESTRLDTARGWAAECLADLDCMDGLSCVAGTCAPDGSVTVPPHTRRLGRISEGEPRQTFEDLRFDARFVFPRIFTQTEVTQAQWVELMGSRPFAFPACGDNCPAENITWGAALAYANERSRRDGLAPCYDLSGCTGDPWDGGLTCAANPPLNDGVTSVYACRGWRLPTEFEWEWAAHAVPDEDRWVPYSRLNACNGDSGPLGDVARVCANAAVEWSGCALDVPGLDCAGPGPVGELQPNPWGLHDILGNVAEFTWSRRVPVPWRNEEVIEPEMQTSAGDLTVRGGSWRSFPVDVRIPGRDPFPSNYRGGDVGFRLVRTLVIED